MEIEQRVQIVLKISRLLERINEMLPILEKMDVEDGYGAVYERAFKKCAEQVIDLCLKIPIAPKRIAYSNFSNNDGLDIYQYLDGKNLNFASCNALKYFFRANTNLDMQKGWYSLYRAVYRVSDYDCAEAFVKMCLKKANTFAQLCES